MITAGGITLAVLVAALVVGLRVTRHSAERTERGYLAGVDAPVDAVRDAQALGWNGDVCTAEVCRCGAARELGRGRWSWHPILHRVDRPVKSLNN